MEVLFLSLHHTREKEGKDLREPKALSEIFLLSSTYLFGAIAALGVLYQVYHLLRFAAITH